MTMRIGRKQKFIVTLAVYIAAVVFVGSRVIGNSFAASGRLYLSPAAASVQNGSTISLNLRLDPGVTDYGVEAVITFDSGKLQYVATDASASAFPVQLTQSATSNSVSISRGNLSGGVSADSLVAVVTFKAIAGSGNAAVQLTGNATDANDYNNPATSGANVALTSPASPTPTPTPAPTPKPTASSPSAPTTSPPKTTTSSPSATPTTPAAPPAAATSTTDPTKPKLSVAPSPQFTFSSLTLSSDKDVTFQVKYGLDPGNLNLQSALVGGKDNGQVKLDALVGGTKYYYQVTATDATGNAATSEVQSFFTKGYTLRISILDKNRKPMGGKKVTLHSDPKTVKTDKQGLATFSDTEPGQHELQYEQAGKVYKQAVQVEDAALTAADGSQAALPQNVSVIYNVVPGSPIMAIVAGLLAAIGLAAVGYVVVSRRQQLQFAFAHGRRSHAATTAGIMTGDLTKQPTAQTHHVFESSTPASKPTAHGPGTVIAPAPTPAEAPIFHDDHKGPDA